MDDPGRTPSSFADPATLRLSAPGDAPTTGLAGTAGDDTRTGTQRQLGTGQFLNADALRSAPSGTAAVLPAGGTKVQVDLVGASVPAAAEAVLGEALGRPYVVAEGVTGRITLQTTGPIERAALLKLFEAALETVDARLQSSNGTLQIVSTRSGRRSIALANGGTITENSIVVAPLRFTSAAQMADLLSDLVGESLTISRDSDRNHLILQGTQPDLVEAVDLINVFDADFLRGRSTALVRLDAAQPDDLSTELEEIFDAGQGGALENVIQFLPNPRLKSILVVSASPNYIAEAEGWIRRLDQTAGRSRRYTEVYRVDNREAESLAPLLQDVLQEAGAEVTVAETDEDVDLAETTEPTGVSIVADTDRNAIIATAFRREHQELRRVIAALDSAPLQVLIEATIAEVSLNDELSLGVRWFFESGDFSFSFSDLASGAVSSAFPGFSGVLSSGGDRVALNALASVTNVKVVSTPSLMVRNNQEAELRIGDQVPIATQTSQATTATDAPVIRTIEYRDTGVILRVKPRIGRAGQVVLDIEQETSDVVATTTSGIDSPTIRQRLVSTDVVVQDGATLVLGGIIQEQDSTINTKVPVLGDIPAVGALFRSKRDEVDRTELLVLIRPVIVRNSSDVAAATGIWRQRLSGANELLENGLRRNTHQLRLPGR
ncbi:MAG: type II secretion system secretin GspD [Pseudomonadota bacterium]